MIPIGSKQNKCPGDFDELIKNVMLFDV
jgi:hypothetical protein